METIERLHHICLTVSSENLKEGWPKAYNFYTGFLGMNAFRVAVEEMDHEVGLAAMEEGMGVGKQTPQVFDEDGEMILEYFHYLAGEDMSESAAMVDLICYLTDPGQKTVPLANMNDLGLRGMTLLVDNVDAIYQRGLDQGVEFLSPPVKLDWGTFGEVVFAVLKDPAGNPVELVQTNEVTTPGDGKVLRIFSINQNTVHPNEMKDFYVDGCGMKLVAEVTHENDGFGEAMGMSGDVKAVTRYLQGSNPDGKTYFAYTFWESHPSQEQSIPEGSTPAYYRMWHWVGDTREAVENLFNKMEPKMKMVAQRPFVVPSPRPWDDVTMSFFIDDDGVCQELANHINKSWHGLGVLVDDETYGHEFHTKY